MNAGSRAASAAVRSIQSLHQDQDAHISTTAEVSLACQAFRDDQLLSTGRTPTLIRMTAQAYDALVAELGSVMVRGFCDPVADPNGRIFGMRIDLVRDAAFVLANQIQHLRRTIEQLDQDLADRAPLLEVAETPQHLRLQLAELLERIRAKRTEYHNRLTRLETEA